MSSSKTASTFPKLSRSITESVGRHSLARHGMLTQSRHRILLAVCGYTLETDVPSGSEGRERGPTVQLDDEPFTCCTPSEQMLCYSADAKSVPTTIATGIPGVAINKLLLVTKLSVLRSHGPSREPVVKQPTTTALSLILRESHHCVVQSTDDEKRFSIALVCRQAWQSTPRKLESCVYSRKIVVREIDELVDTHSEACD